MLLSKLYFWIPEGKREDFVGGLLVGSIAGLIGGLFIGLSVLSAGLSVGLFIGLIAGLSELSQSLQSLVIILIIIVCISEILFWLDKHQWEKLNRWENTLCKKLECLAETSLVVVNVRNVVVHYRDVISFFETQTGTIQLVLSFVGYGTIIALCILGWFWLNSLKYKEKKE